MGVSLVNGLPVSEVERDVKQTSNGEPPPKRSRCRQWIAAFMANLAAMCGGAALAWSAPALPVLQGEASDAGEAWAGGWTQLLLPAAPLTSGQGALVASLVPLGAMVGALPAGWMARRAGCRRPLLALSALFSAGWMLVLLARPAGLCALLAGRALHGVATGAATVLVARYCDEVAEVAVRGAVGALLDLSLCNGALLVYALALALPYALLTVACAAVPLLFAACFAKMPESPVYLARQGRREEAMQALQWLRPGWGARALARELADLTAHEEEPASSPSDHTPADDPPAYDDVVSSDGADDPAPTYDSVALPSQPFAAEDCPSKDIPPDAESLASVQSISALGTEQFELKPLPLSVRPQGDEAPPASCSAHLVRHAAVWPTTAKAIFIVYTLMFLQQAAAITAVMSYATQMFAATDSTLAPAVSTVVLGGLQSVAGATAALSVERAGRRPLLVGSAVAAGAALATMAVVDTAIAPWLPTVALGAYIFTFELGLGPLPWFITAELVGPMAGGGAAAVNWATAAAVTELYPGMAKRFGQRVVFAAFAVMAGAAAAFTVVCVPETRGKTRAQLKRELQHWPRRAPRPFQKVP